MRRSDHGLPYGGVIHTYRKYDPQRFPMPAAEPPDLVSPAFEHLLHYGSLRQLTEEELAEAVEIDPRQIAGLGPSIESLLAILEERKRKILETYETENARRLADHAYQDAVHTTRPPKHRQQDFLKAVRSEQIVDLERLWYREDQRSDFARQLVQLMERLGDKYQVEELAAKYAFTGKRPMDVPKALEIKEELETIERLIEQLKQAAKDAKIYVVNLDELAQFVDQEQVDNLAALQRQVADLLRQLAEQQGIRQDGGKFSLTPKAFKVFQTKLLDRIFSDLQAAKTGRHHVELNGDGAVELQRTKPYEFGDSLANMDVGAGLINALVRTGPGLPVRLQTRDLEIHLTRNTPKCATVVCLDMSGSMRFGLAYVNVKRMALALHGLIRADYPGDFVDFVEIYTFAKRRHIAQVPELLPKPVTLSDPWVRLKVDMSQEGAAEWAIHPHFTNLQHGLKLARQVLQAQDTPNRQIVLITDGLPTAHFEGPWLYLLYPPDPRTEHFTLREGLLCREGGITLNIFLLSSWNQTREDIQFAYRLAESTQGRVFFVAGGDLERYVVWDYLKRRRFIIG
jgi:uncharacterized protein with von Willebrand factor type A (vWA) domain